MSLPSSFRLDGHLALVTGARRGMGLAIAAGLAEAGADVLAVSAQMEEDGGAVRKAVEGAGRRCLTMRCDLAQREEVYRLLDRISNERLQVDILVNNAGTTRRHPAAEYPDDDWDRVLALNLTTPFILSRELGRSMLERGWGKILFIASLMSFQGGILIPAYTASKGGLAQLTKALANEWAARGVGVNAIAPGYIATDLTEPLRQDPGRNPAILARIPAGRWGRPDDLVGAAVFLCSHASDYVHGTVLPVDGGWLGR